MKPKRIAMVGLGGISRTHLHHLGCSPAFELAGGVDPSSGQREAFSASEGAPAYASFEALLGEQEIDGMIVATPPTVREPIIRQGLERRIAILAEKPLAADACTAQQLAEHPLAAELLHVGYCHRWTGASQAARRLISEETLGELVAINICFSGWMPGMQSHWMSDPAISGGGALIDNGCHALDLFSYLGGKLECVKGTVRQSWHERGEDSFALAVRSERGTIGTLQGSYLYSAPRNEWEVIGTKATLRYSYDRDADKLIVLQESEQHSIPVEAPSLRFARQLHEWQRALQGHATEMATAAEGAEINRWLQGVMSPILCDALAS